MYSLGANFGVGSWSTQFKLSLLTGLGPFASSCPALMPAVLRNTHFDEEAFEIEDYIVKRLDLVQNYMPMIDS